jgi:hypothetical protein
MEVRVLPADISHMAVCKNCGCAIPLGSKTCDMCSTLGAIAPAQQPQVWAAPKEAVPPANSAEVIKAQKAMRRAFWIFAVVGAISVGLGALAELAELTALLGLFNWASVGEGAIFLLLAYWTQRGSFIATALGTGLYVIDSVLLLVTGHFSIVRVLIIVALVRAVLSANLLRQQRQQAMSTIGGGDQTRVA